MHFSVYPLQQYVSNTNVIADCIFRDLYRTDLDDGCWGCPLQRLLLCLRRNRLADGCCLTCGSDFESGVMSDVIIPASLNELICRETRRMPPPLFDESGVCVVHEHCGEGQGYLHVQGQQPPERFYLLMPLIRMECGDLLWLIMHRRSQPFTVDELVTCQIALHKAIRLAKPQSY